MYDFPLPFGPQRTVTVPGPPSVGTGKSNGFSPIVEEGIESDLIIGTGD
jgi:hypothetical protein